MPTLAGNKQLSVHFFPHGPRFSHLSTRKSTGLIRQKWTSTWLFPCRHDKNYKQKIKKVFHKRKLLKNAPNISKIHKIKHIKSWIKFMFTCVYILHRLNPLLGTNLIFFLASSSFLQAVSHFGQSVPEQPRSHL